MRTLKALVFALVVYLAGSSTAFAEVQLTIRDGRVSLVAKDATVRQILAEWARVGQTKVVNVERIPGGPLTLELTNVSEQQALEVLLRSVGGYMLAPRPTVASNLSRFDRIIVMPTSVPPRAVAAPPSPVFQPPQFPQPGLAPADEDADDDRPSPAVPIPTPNRPPVFGTFPQPQVVPQQQGQPPPVPGATGVPQQQNIGAPRQPFVPPQPVPPSPPPTSTPTAPTGGVARPGMITPAPPQQPGAPAGRPPNSPEG